MILDQQNQYSAAQALTVSAVSQNIIDHGSDRDLGVGEEMGVVVTVDVAPKSSDANETYAAKVQVDSDPAFGTAVDLFSITIDKATALGAQFVIPVNKDFKWDRYSRLSYTLGGTNPTITLSAELAPLKAIPAYKSYPKGYTIS